MELKHIVGNTYCIDTGMTSIPFYKFNEREIIMLDTGWADGERAGIEAILEAEKLRVSGIITSHAHVDHTGSNMYFRKKYGSVIAMSAVEASICHSALTLKSYYSGHSMKDIVNHLGTVISETDIIIQEGDREVTICGVTFGIVETPGHTPAHISVITPDHVMYVGDSLISYEVMKGAKMPYAFALKEDIKSKQKLKTITCDYYVLAHNGIFTDIQALVEDNITFYKSRAARVKEVITAPMTQEQLLKAVISTFNIRIKSIHYQLVIERMMRSYLDYLMETDEVRMFLDDGFIKFECIEKP